MRASAPRYVTPVYLATILAAVFLAAQFIFPGPADAKIMHVWSQAPTPDPNEPYGSRKTAARKIADALKKAKKGDVILVHGKCKKKDAKGKVVKLVQCNYSENIKIPCGVTLNGKVDKTRDQNDYWYPIIDGGWSASVIKGGKCDPASPSDRIWIIHFVITNGKADQGGGISIVDTSAYISDNCIVSNEAHKGGGIALQWSTNNLVSSYITGNLIGNSNRKLVNTANKMGGGVYVGGVYDPSETKLVDGTQCHYWFPAILALATGDFDGVPVLDNCCPLFLTDAWCGDHQKRHEKPH